MRHRFHSICPYFAMFPESFAETWIDRLTKPGDVVLDPFSGRGTTAFQSLLMGRRAIAVDVNDVAVCLTTAKTSPPSLPILRRRITQLEHGFDGRNWQAKAERTSEFFKEAFSRRTLQQLLYLRTKLKWKTSKVDSMVAALCLGSLHGEMNKSSSYFSNQMPRTISTKPAYSVKYWRERNLVAPERDVFEIIRQRAAFRYVSEVPKGEAYVLHSDMRELPWCKDALPKPIQCAITSPPYFDVTNFEEDQWLRLWFLGGPPAPTTGRLSRDDRHSMSDDYWRFIADMWRSLGAVMTRNAHIVVRIGTGRIPPEALVQSLTATAVVSKRKVRLVESTISELRNRQTDLFRPGSKGCSVEVDCHFTFIN